MDSEEVKQMYREMYESLIMPNFTPDYPDWNCDYFIKKLKWSSAIGCEADPYQQILETIKFPEFEHDYEKIAKILKVEKSDYPVF